MAPRIAGIQPSIVRPLTNAATINNTTALTTKANSPKVIIVKGSVIKLKMGLIKVLITASTTAASTAAPKLAT